MPEVKAAQAPPRPTSDAARAAQPRIGYDGQATQNLVVSIRGFRLMVGLMLVNTVLIASSVLGPQLFPFLRGQWQQWQARRAAAAQARADLAIRQQCLVHKMPQGKVVYEEDPDAAAKLLAGGAGEYHAAVNFPQHPPPGWMPPVTAAPPKDYTEFLRVAFNRNVGGGEYPLLFLHERSTPGGQKHLVTVSLVPGFQFNEPLTRAEDEGIGGRYGGGGYPGNRGRGGERPQGLKVAPGETVFVMEKRRVLSVVTYLSGQAGTAVADYRGKRSALSRSFMLELPDSKSWVVARVMQNPPGNEPPKLNYGHRLRFLAGQPDPNDPSHFTIPYQLDGRDGVIDGWVKDGGIDLRPREGQWGYGEEGEVWKLPVPPATPSGTQPATQPTDATRPQTGY
jgi:hypothetical protein